MAMREVLQKLIVEPADANYDGSDWWQLSKAEAEIFSLRLDDMPRLLVAWSAYEACRGDMPVEVAGITESDVGAERTRRPEFFDGSKTSLEAFTTLAGEWCGISQRQADAMHAKIHFRNVRYTGVTYKDEV